MKPFYTHEVLFQADREELLMMRVAISCWLAKHKDWKEGIPEDADYWWKQFQLYKDITKCVEQLPF